jgi:DNA-3-methyladenine glycosylase I
MSKSYCEAVRSGALHAVHGVYHNHHYGFPITDDDELFERLMLEINQAGLSWEIILKKQPGFRDAFDGFNLEKVAAYGEADRARLLADAGIIRNRLKVNAAIENAKRILEIRHAHGSFCAWLDAHHPLEITDWQKLFKKTFVFTGGEIVREFLTSTGYLAGAHDADCSVYNRISMLEPAWMRLKIEP